MSINKTGPTINKGNSKQDYATDDSFIQAAVSRFGPLAFDLAASAENTKAPDYYSEKDNSLVQKWEGLDGNLWLNPPFDPIAPWAKKCAASSFWGNPNWRILFLVPASVGSEWFRLYVKDRAYVLALSPRLTFVGCKDPYPKDLILAVYGHGLHGFDTWRWKK